MTLSSRSVLVAALALSMTVLTGCGGADPATSPTAEPSSATPTPTAVAAPSAPEPVIDLACADLATSFLPTLLPAEGDRVARDGGARVTNEVRMWLGAQYSVRSAGGLACEWSNGLTYGADGNPALVGVEVMILPDATSQFARWTDYYSLDGTASCRGEIPYCDSNELVGTTWISISATGTTGDGFVSYAAEVRDLVVAAGPGAEPWTPETAIGPGGCDAIVPASTVATSLGLDELRTDVPHGGWSIEAAADENFGTLRCFWSFPDSDLAAGMLNALPGGAWAWRVTAPTLTSPSTTAALDVPGLSGDDEAWLRCAEAGDVCVVDLVLGTDWIEYRVNTSDPEYTPAFDVRAGAVALAAAIVANRP